MQIFFFFRAAYWFKYYGHGYQMNHIGNIEPKDVKQIFLCKHLINFFDLLLQAKILVDEKINE
jgi:hypothetical protein